MDIASLPIRLSDAKSIGILVNRDITSKETNIESGFSLTFLSLLIKSKLFFIKLGVSGIESVMMLCKNNDRLYNGLFKDETMILRG